MADHVLQRAVPNEQWQMVLEFAGPEYRLFDTSILRNDNGWVQLAYPQHLKRYTVTPDGIHWPEGGTVDAGFLHQRSKPLDPAALRHQVLRLSYKNQAPTSEDRSHHVYGVYLARFSQQPVHIEESIGGGMAERGGGREFSIEELLAWPEWREHFTLSGCAWAIPKVEQGALDTLVVEACRRNGLPD
ncbi:hypothetical protein [Duganella aceris]|uniref:DUF2442 domain-containing protein n=1 Tax=Duganella aceris TaxID=2703883 RepID=A0ABX0FJ65_9BURK|nr:hypothetical protein [Duganella aceris]NGZ84571.1 hypothetical protein [Duganella aceris]